MAWDDESPQCEIPKRYKGAIGQENSAEPGS